MSLDEASAKTVKSGTKVVFKKRTKLDFTDMDIEGELKDPAEFYFKHRPEEKFDSLVKRRKEFHRDMLRDVAITK